jgi:hypothetical protein
MESLNDYSNNSHSMPPLSGHPHHSSEMEMGDIDLVAEYTEDLGDMPEFGEDLKDGLSKLLVSFLIQR